MTSIYHEGKAAKLAVRSRLSTQGTHALDELPSDPLSLGQGGRHLIGKSSYLSSKFQLAITNQELADSPPCTPDGLVCLNQFLLARLDLHPTVGEVLGHRLGSLAHVCRLTS